MRGTDVVDKDVFRRAMGRFATGVTVVTTQHEGRSHGMTLSAMTSLSLEPPMLLICVNKAAPTERAISASGRFVVNILADHQERVARRFAKPAKDKFEGIDTFTDALGAPIIAGSLAYFECTVGARSTGGTHTIFTGDVCRAQIYERRPLLYYGAEFGSLERPDQRRRGTPHDIALAYDPLEPFAPVGGGGPVPIGSYFWS